MASMVSVLESEFEASLRLTERVLSMVSSGGQPGATLATMMAVEEELDEGVVKDLQELRREQRRSHNLIQLCKELELKLENEVAPLLNSVSDGLKLSLKDVQQRGQAQQLIPAEQERQQHGGPRQHEKTGVPKRTEGRARHKSGCESNVSSGFTPIEMLTVSELETTPKYVRGRLTYEIVKASVVEFNHLLQNKYEFLAKGFQAHASLKDKKKYKELRAQESVETAGHNFVLASELNGCKGFMRTEAGRRAVIGVLRHNKRIKEIRANMGVSKLVVVNGHL